MPENPGVDQMVLITLQNIKKSYSGTMVLADAGLALNPGDKVGLVGGNGSGKTTLLNIAAGIVSPDDGIRKALGSPSCGLLEQTPDFKGAGTVFEAAALAQVELIRIENELDRLSEAMKEAAEDAEELDRLIRSHTRLEERFRLLGGYSGTGKVEMVLAGLGFTPDDFSKNVNHLSGGEARRLQLARVLLGGHDILFLDEPGNHLDLAGTEWLTTYLNDYPGAVLIVSHDRYLLNGVVTQIVQLIEGRTYSYRGNYDFFQQEYPARAEAALKKKEQQDKVIAKGEEFIRRNFYGQKSKQAKSKRKMLDRIEEVNLFRPPEYGSFAFKEASLNCDIVLSLKKVSATIKDKALFTDVELDLELGETLGVIGPNGSGKSTLLKIIMNLIPPTSGEVVLSPWSKCLYFDQQLEGLNESGTVLEELREVAPTATDGELRTHLARFLFKGEDVFKDVASLSGGEKSRALLAKRLLSPTNLLILDEPTNHLDIYIRESLEKALKQFAGATVIVSHDRKLLDGVVDKLLILGEQKPTVHTGNYSSYAERLKREQQAALPQKTKQTKQASSRKPERPRNKVVRKHTYEDLEALIIRKENRLEEIESEIYKEEVYMDHLLSRKLQEEAKELKTELEALYKEWDTWV
ncbi:MAG: ABC-F family ATP-binding cassette domain-containing protein [Planctomycetota bacterium]